MLLVDHVLAAARVWRHRETVELEASAAFARLARELAAVGAAPVVVAMAAEAAGDERDHAVRCRAIVDRLGPELSPVAPRAGVELGPRTLPPRRRALYAAVAMSCVTETISAALLVEMRACATDPVVAETVQHILRDEVRHSRLGWAHLAAEAAAGDVSWLAPHIAPMLRAAVSDDVAVTSAATGAPEFGVLPAAKVRAIVTTAVSEIIAPGLRAHGIEAQGLSFEVEPRHV